AEVAPGGSHLPRLRPSLPPDHDDDYGRVVRWIAAGARHGHGGGAAPSARNRNRGRFGVQPDADALHHARHLSVPRSLPNQVGCVASRAVATSPRSNNMTFQRIWHCAVLLAGAAASACTVGPEYVKPPIVT